VTPRRRSSRKAGWPANLYESRGYYTYRNPVNKETFGLGRDKREAFNQAVEANLHLANELHKERLIDRIKGTHGHTLKAWLEKYAVILAEREPPLAVNTINSYRNLSNRALAMLGTDTKVRSITALQISDGLDAMARSGKASTAHSLRGFLHESFRVASLKGWRDANDNPVREVRGPTVKVKRARLTLDIFKQVYNADIQPWLKNAMALGLVSGQRREDLSRAKFKDIRDHEWWVEQGKTGARVIIPTSLRLDIFGMSLHDVIQQCRGTHVLSPYLIHQTGTGSPKGQHIWKDTISRQFSEALADLKLDFAGKNPPTFHEIRSLSARLYKQQGGVNTQELLGHKTPQTTLLYEDGRGEWIRVRVGK
jgi:enterobacteria phage integrase